MNNMKIIVIDSINTDTTETAPSFKFQTQIFLHNFFATKYEYTGGKWLIGSAGFPMKR